MSSKAKPSKPVGGAGHHAPAADTHAADRVAITFSTLPSAAPAVSPARIVRNRGLRSQFPVWFPGESFASEPLSSADAAVVSARAAAEAAGVRFSSASDALGVPADELALVWADPAREAAALLAAVDAHCKAVVDPAPHEHAPPPPQDAAAAAGKKKSAKESAAEAEAAAAAAAAAASAAEAASVARRAALEGPLRAGAAGALLAAPLGADALGFGARVLLRDVIVPESGGSGSSALVDRALRAFATAVRVIGSPVVAPSVARGAWLWEAISRSNDAPGVFGVRVWWAGAWRRVRVDTNALPAAVPVSEGAKGELWPSVLWGAWWSLVVGDALAAPPGSRLSASSARDATDVELIVTTLSGLYAVPLTVLAPALGAAVSSDEGSGGGVGGWPSAPTLVTLGVRDMAASPSDCVRDAMAAARVASVNWLQGIEDAELNAVTDARNAAMLQVESGDIGPYQVPGSLRVSASARANDACHLPPQPPS